MKAHRVSAAIGKIGLPRFFVIGDVELIMEYLREKNSKLLEVKPGSREEIRVEEFSDELGLDPGGGMMIEEALDFTLLDVKFYIYPHKLKWMYEDISNAEEVIPGYYGIKASNRCISWFIYMTSEMREALLGQLMSYEFSPGVKESHDQAKEIEKKLVAEGLVAGQHLQINEPPEDTLGFTIPEGIDPF